MSLSSLSKSIICMVLALNLGACSYLLPNTSPNLGGLLAEKGDTRPFEVPLPVNTDPKRMALGAMFTIGVKADGTVWSWGAESSGELGQGTFFITNPVPSRIPNMTDFVEVAAGNNHVLALRKDGTVWSWGDNKKGQLGYKEDGYVLVNNVLNTKSYQSIQTAPKQIPELKDVVSIAAGGNYSLALDKQGRVWGWGSELYLLGNHGNIKQPDPKVIYQHVDAIKIVANGTVGLGVLLKTGKVKLWSAADVYEPIFNDPVVDIAMSYSNTYFLLNTGRVYALGSNISGELAQRGDEELKNPKLIKQIGRIKKISTYTALDEQGRVWQWGKEAGLEIDTLFSGRNYYAQFYPSVMLSHKKITDVYCCTAALDADGSVWFWGNDTTGRRGNNQKSIDYRHQKKRDWTTPVRSLWTWK